jgi:predicted CoA-binding protein
MPMDRNFYENADLRSILEETRRIAVVGASPNPARPSNQVLGYLIARGYEAIPINPGHAGGRILGQTVYARLADLPAPVDMVDVFRRNEFLAGVVEDVLALPWKPKTIWIQLGLRDDNAARRAEAAGIKVVQDRCIKIEDARLMR